MPLLDDYVTDVLLRDLVCHDRKPSAFLVYLWLAAQQQRSGQPLQISYQDLAENIGISKSSACTGWRGANCLQSARKASPRRRSIVC